MTTKFITLISVIGLASICLVQGQSPTPGESPAVSPSPTESPAASPSPAKKAEATATAPAASPSPKEKRSRKKGKTEVAASPAPSPSPATRTTTAASTKATPAPGGGPGIVWVSMDTHVYHKEGSRFYGKTKNGKYMSEADARKEGNRLAREDNY
jgi:outer membrane biosynthesis protein TonB